MKVGHTFRYELRALDGKPICGFEILEQCRAWFHRVCGHPCIIVDNENGTEYRIEPNDAERGAVAGPSQFDGATMTNLALIYNAGCCDPSFNDAREAVERALSSVKPEAGNAALAAQLMIAILNGAHR